MQASCRSLGTNTHTHTEQQHTGRRDVREACGRAQWNRKQLVRSTAGRHPLYGSVPTTPPCSMASSQAAFEAPIPWSNPWKTPLRQNLALDREVRGSCVHHDVPHR